jgi:undecaprenyl-diphosphatase
MQLIDILFLSIIQGVSEFLPISSSAHLAIYSFIFNRVDQGLIMDIVLHLGTLIAVITYFWRDIYGFMLALYAPKKHRADLSLMLKLGTATLPILVVGVLLGDSLEQVFRSPLIIAFNLIIFGFILWWAFTQSKRKELDTLSYKQALVIGCSQVLAIIPGVSRSGITMSMAFFYGYSRLAAAKFSMLLSIPTIAGAALSVLPKLLSVPSELIPLPYIVTGLLLSALCGMLAIHILMSFMQKISYKVFTLYRLVLGLLIIAFYLVK